MLLQVPSRPWDNISRDFLDRLLKTKSGYDYFFVIVDHFSKMVILIPCKQGITGEGVAKLFFQHVETFWLTYIDYFKQR